MTGIAPDLVKDLEDWRLVQPEQIEGTKFYDDTDREIVQASAELARFGVGGRDLKVLRTAADHEAQLFEAVVGAALRSTNHNTRREAMENLESLTAVPNNLTHMLLVRDLRKLTGEGQAAPWHALMRSRRIAAPASALWAVVTDPYHLPRWWLDGGAWRT